MVLSNNDLRKEFLSYLTQSDSCELFYIYMKSEHLAYVLEFYLACDGLKNLIDKKTNPGDIIQLIYKYYLSNGKSLSSSKLFSLTDYLLVSIKQRLMKREFHLKFYDHAQEYVLKYMLQMCYPKFIIQQENLPETKRQARCISTFTPMLRRSLVIRKKDVFDKWKQQSSTLINQNSSEVSTDHEISDKCNLAQRNPAAFFEEIKTRLLAYQTEIRASRMVDDDSLAVLDLQIAKTIDDIEPYTFTRSDSGVGTEKNYEIVSALIDVIWYPSLDSKNALLSTISYPYNQLTFKEFRRLFKKQNSFRYFFKTICTPDINNEQYVFRELTTDDELIPFYNGKIFVQLDRIS